MKIIVKDLIYKIDDGLSKDVFTLGEINFNFEPKKFYGIIGPTGSGKTTFIQHLNVLNTPKEGEIQYIFEEKINKLDKKSIKKNITKTKNKNYTNKIIKETDEEFLIEKTITIKKKRKIKNVNEIRKRVGIVFQFAEYQLFEETIEKDIIFGPITMGISKEKAKEIAKKAIVKVGLDESFLEVSPFSLSGGQKRRVALAGVLSMEPEYLIFDEPTAGLDREGVKEILELFQDLNKKGHTIIIVTHDLDNVLSVTDETIFFKDGKIKNSGKTIDILSDNEFLKSEEMEPPKILDFKWKLEEKGMKIGQVRTIEDLAKEINKNLLKRKGK